MLRICHKGLTTKPAKWFGSIAEILWLHSTLCTCLKRRPSSGELRVQISCGRDAMTRTSSEWISVSTVGLLMVLLAQFSYVDCPSALWVTENRIFPAQNVIYLPRQSPQWLLSHPTSCCPKNPIEEVIIAFPPHHRTHYETKALFLYCGLIPINKVT